MLTCIAHYMYVFTLSTFIFHRMQMKRKKKSPVYTRDFKILPYCNSTFGVYGSVAGSLGIVSSVEGASGTDSSGVGVDSEGVHTVNHSF